jgi:hypothetical protein
MIDLLLADVIILGVKVSWVNRTKHKHRAVTAARCLAAAV